MAFLYRPFRTPLDQTRSFLFYAGAYIYRVVKHALWGPPRRTPPRMGPQKEGLYISLSLLYPHPKLRRTPAREGTSGGPNGPLGPEQREREHPKEKKERKERKKKAKTKAKTKGTKTKAQKGGCQADTFYELSFVILSYLVP